METTQLKPNSLEKVLLEPFSKLPKKPMTEDETKTMISLSFVPEENQDAMYEDVKKQSWVLQAMEKRIEQTFTVEIEKKVQIFLLMFLEGNIGRCMVYLLYLQYWGKKNNSKNITWDNFTMKIFPMGFPDKNKFTELWDKQKVNGANMIDILEAHKSIHFEA